MKTKTLLAVAIALIINCSGTALAQSAGDPLADTKGWIVMQLKGSTIPNKGSDGSVNRSTYEKIAFTGCRLAWVYHVVSASEKEGFRAAYDIDLGTVLEARAAESIGGSWMVLMKTGKEFVEKLTIDTGSLPPMEEKITTFRLFMPDDLTAEGMASGMKRIVASCKK